MFFFDYVTCDRAERELLFTITRMNNRMIGFLHWCSCKQLLQLLDIHPNLRLVLICIYLRAGMAVNRAKERKNRQAFFEI